MLLDCLAGNVPPGHANMAAQHVINMQTNMTPTMYVQHHPGNYCMIFLVVYCYSLEVAYMTFCIILMIQYIW